MFLRNEQAVLLFVVRVLLLFFFGVTENPYAFKCNDKHTPLVIDIRKYVPNLVWFEKKHCHSCGGFYFTTLSVNTGKQTYKFTFFINGTQKRIANVVDT
jgi:hypothetical protein